MKYVETQHIIDDYLQDHEGNSDAFDSLERMNESVSEFADDFCKRRRNYFAPAGVSATARNFRGQGRNFLQIPIHVAGTVSIDGVAASAVYEETNSGWIYSKSPVVNISDCGGDGFFVKGQLYVVRARWGYEDTPAPIKEAIKQTVARWFDVQRGVLGQVTPGGFVIERDMPPSAKTLLENYKKREFEID